MTTRTDPETVPVTALDGDHEEHDEWRRFRKASPNGDWGIPKGTYDAHLRNVTLTRRRDTGAWGLRFLFLCDSNGRYGFAWRPLAKDGTDPFALTSSQHKSFGEFAERMGVNPRQPVNVIVNELQHMVGSPVRARVYQSPVGSKAVVERAEDTVPAPANGNSPSTSLVKSESAENAYKAHTALIESLAHERLSVIYSAEACYFLRSNKAWEALGFHSLGEYLAQPELGMARSKFHALASIFEVFHVEHGIGLEELSQADWTKLQVVLRAVGDGDTDAQQALDDALMLGVRDLREQYQLGAAKDPTSLANPESDDDEPLDGEVESRRLDYGDSTVSRRVVLTWSETSEGKVLHVKVGQALAALDKPTALRVRDELDDFLRWSDD